jgi:hypothetical protein
VNRRQRQDEVVQRPIYTSRKETVCPLCGHDLGLSTEPEKPCIILEKLGAHFAADCRETRRFSDV